MASNERKTGSFLNSGFLRGVSALVIIIVVVLALTLFFKVTKVEINGTDKLSAEQLCEAVGLELGDNILSVKKNEIAEKIFENFIITVESVSVTRKLPNRLVVDITERVPAAYMVSAGRRWVIDVNGIVMRNASSDETKDLIEIKGLTALAPVAGEKVVVSEGDERSLNYTIELLTKLRELGMIDGAEMIDASDVSDFEFEYLGRFTVRLGSSAELDYKLSAIGPIIETLSDGDRGTIDVSGGSEKRKYFRPE